jgi:ABC-type multidrug transport system fused ATPase/permease subunit
MTTLVIEATLFLSIFALFLAVDWVAALFIAAYFIILVYVLQLATARRFLQSGRNVRQSSVDTGGAILEMVDGFREIAVLSKQDYFLTRFIEAKKLSARTGVTLQILKSLPRYIAEATSHEIGHTLTLRHDGRISPAEGYYTGHGEGEVGWAPIMGVGYYKLLVQWSRGEYLSANNTEDDLGRITTLNGFGYRVDQVGNTTASASPLTGTSGARSASGILETTGDLDVFSFSTAGGVCSFTALGDPVSQNVDLLVEILDAGGSLIAAANPATPAPTMWNVGALTDWHAG